jgi:transcriptional regulator of acetoin/glycerol metabolism
MTAKCIRVLIADDHPYWNKSKAARQLGISRTQLYLRLRKHGLENVPE